MSSSECQKWIDILEGARGGGTSAQPGLTKKQIVFVRAHYKHVRIQNTGTEVLYEKWPCDISAYDPVHAEARTRRRKSDKERPAMGT